MDENGVVKRHLKAHEELFLYEVIVHLARSAESPSPEDAVMHLVPPSEVYGLASGWLREPRATLLIRTQVDEAKLLRAPHEAREVEIYQHILAYINDKSGLAD